MLLEASPTVEALCESPGFVIIGGQQLLADFWVRYADRHELGIRSEIMTDDDAISEAVGTLDMRGLSIRRVEPAELSGPSLPERLIAYETHFLGAQLVKLKPASSSARSDAGCQ
ncbi:hypothetical protein PPGU19_095480 (plasmid) [Paraburkholderia sp. PGU19]|nr:hypothetical protein PPGU19_095480 [Paraburkholderia sp. PGU19]